MNELRTLYPEIECYRSDFLSVSNIHSIYWEESGNPNGQPIIYLHGGPGGATSPQNRSYFNPEYYRIILMDQRGCGKSTPHASLEHNTTWDLVEDMEKLRHHLNIGEWILFGGSWGSTLALTYAIMHPLQVNALILRGIFLCRKKELRWFYEGEGTRYLFPDEWEKFSAVIPKEEQHNMIQAYYQRLTSNDVAVRKKAAFAWSGWEASTVCLRFDPTLFNDFTEDEHADAFARIECHYFVNDVFFKTDNWILENISRIQHIPGIIVHGRYDVICPLDNAWELHKAWPISTLEIVPAAGHAGKEPGITDALVRATDFFSNHRACVIS